MGKMNKQQRLDFEFYVYELFEQLEIDDTKELYKIQEDLEDLIQYTVDEYAEDNKLEG